MKEAGQSNSESIDLQPMFDFLLAYYDKEPFISNIIALSIPSAVFVFMFLKHLEKRKRMQIEDKMNIRKYEIALKKLEKIEKRNDDV